MILKINFVDTLKNYQLIFYAISIIILIKIFNVIQLSVFHYFTFFVLFALLIIWAFFIHFQYYIDGRNKTIIIKDNRINCLFGNNLSSKEFNFDDIDKILYVRSASIDPPFVFTHTVVENFHFIRFYFKDKTSLNITSLMKSDLTSVAELFSEFEIIRVKRGFCSLKSNYNKYFIN